MADSDLLGEPLLDHRVSTAVNDQNSSRNNNIFTISAKAGYQQHVASPRRRRRRRDGVLYKNTVIKVPKGFKLFPSRHGKWYCYHRRTNTSVDVRNKFEPGFPEFYAECERISVEYELVLVAKPEVKAESPAAKLDPAA